MEVLAGAGDSVSLYNIPRFENEKTALGAGWSQEFWPRWTQGADYVPSTADQLAGHADVILTQVDAYKLKATVSSPIAEPLRFTSLYFPGWRVTLDDGTALPTYPSTNMGLLTVDLPPGSHELFLDWAGTGVQRAATWLSLITLAGLVVFVWRTNRPRWLAAIPLGLLALGLATMLAKSTLADIQVPAAPVATRGLEMVGYRLERGDAYELNIYPYWYIRQNPSAEMSVRWQLRDATGRVLSEVSARPYFNSQAASNWPSGTLVDDAYRLPLPSPSQKPPFSYQLVVQVVEGDEATAWTPVGAVNITTPPSAQPQPAHSLAARFGGLVDLVGVDLKQGGRAVEAWAPRPPVVRPGDSLEYTLYWQALQQLQRDYHGLVHLVDRAGRPIAKQDQLVGSRFRPPTLWDFYSLQPDRYPLRIPEDTPSGLYWPMVGLYEFKGVDLLPVADANGQVVGDTYRLPPVKVVGSGLAARPQHEVAAQLGDLATLVGYDLALPNTGLRAGSQVSLTLHYQANATIAQDLTRFVQLYSPTLGMAAQQDSLPQDGNNPTWAWVPGEVVSDTVTLTVSENAKPGKYALQVGLYNPSDGMRLPVRDRAGNPLPDGQVILTEVSLLP
jgi:hypothetical protein